MMAWPRLLLSLASWVARALRNQRGQVALIFALAAPTVALLTVGAVELNDVQSSRARLQNIADAAALAGANELGLAIDDVSAIARAGVFVAGHLHDWPDAPMVTPRIRVFERDGQRVIEVVLDGHTPSFFANMLPPGGWAYTVESRAAAANLTPLCVLVSGDSGSRLLHIQDTGRLQAPDCLVHSNRDIVVEGGSITAYQVQAVTSAQGMISPVPGTGASPIEDPFKDMNLQEQQPCDLLDLGMPLVLLGTVYVAPGVHCGGFRMGGNAELILGPGEHWFLGGHLEIKDNARLSGRDVVLLFDKTSKFDFKDHARVDLEGRKSGPYAGMVMIGARGNTQDFVISSDNVDSLLGVIYAPEAQLIVEGKADVARDSAWTVIVARSVRLKGEPSLIINANYAGSTVPAPTGVGPRDGGSQLVE